jgi:uncharacterized protein GlcG (DUF336 family)
MANVDLVTAKKIIAGAFDKGRELGLKPLSVVVLDAGGHPVAFERQDGASLGRFAIATGKAAGALFLGVSSRKIGEMALERPTFLAALGPLAPSGIVPAAGGTILVGADGRPIGSVGVTGDTSDNDEIAGLAGVAASGMTPGA